MALKRDMIIFYNDPNQDRKQLKIENINPTIGKNDLQTNVNALMGLTRNTNYTQVYLIDTIDLSTMS